MKNKIFKVLPWVLITACLIGLMPALINRTSNEAKNDNIVMAALYNDIRNKVSQDKRDGFFYALKENGIDTVAVMEEDLNMLVSAGEVTSIKLNVLKHKYEDENLLLGEAIQAACPSISQDSHIVLAKRPETREKLSYHLGNRYGENDYAFVGNAKDIIEKYCEVENIDVDLNSDKYINLDMDVYVFFDGQKELWNYAIGYDEEEIKYLKDNGYNVSLIFKVKNYKNTGYLKDLDRIVKTYGIEYLNLKEDNKLMNPGKKNTGNYEGLADIINENNMTLVVTENTDQLSNQKFFGYDYVFEKVMKSDEGSHKVMRSYETYDDSQADESIFGHRVSQHFNSTVDRNIRFVTITQIATTGTSYNDLADNTYKAAVEYKQKIEDEGFTVGGETQALDYTANEKLNYALCCVIMVMALLLMLRMIFAKDYINLSMVASVVAVIGFIGTYFLYNKFPSLISLYPTLYCVILSSFAMTALLSFIRKCHEKTNMLVLLITSLIVLMGTLLIGTVGMGAMLSGIDYYVNNSIFRGIKLSLLVPVFYTTVIYYIMFVKSSPEDRLLKKIPVILNKNIKVYWVLLGGIILAVGAYYILRSGNVNSISGVEAKLRSTLTELFPARPRTKEFLIGYPSLCLLVYYSKYIDIKLIKWLFAIGTSILAASVTNSFCHVFTDYTTIVQRTVNGLIVGLVVSVIALIANHIIVKIARYAKKHIS